MSAMLLILAAAAGANGPVPDYRVDCRVVGSDGVKSTFELRAAGQADAFEKVKALPGTRFPGTQP